MNFLHSILGDKKKVLVTACAMLSFVLASCSPLAASVSANTPVPPVIPTSQPDTSGLGTRLPLEYISPLPNA